MRPAPDDLAAAVPHEVQFGLPWCTRDALLLVDEHGRALWCNPAFEHAAGRSHADTVGLGLAALLPVSSASRGALLAAAARLAQGLDFAATEVELWRPRRTPCWLRISSQRLRVVAAGQPHSSAAVRVLCVMQDISATKRLQTEALHLAELLGMAQSFGRIGVWQRELPSGTDDRQLDNVHHFHGLDPAQEPPSDSGAVEDVHPDDRARLLAAQTFDTPGTYSHRYRVVRADGKVRHLHSIWEVKPPADADAPRRVVGVLVDDSEAYALARSVDDANRQLKLALELELGKIAVWRQDLRTDHVQCADGGYAAIGIAPRPQGLTLGEGLSVIHPDDLARVEESTRLALATRKPVDLEARFRGHDGSWRHMLARRVVEVDAAGAPVALIGVALDVTARMREKQRAADLLRQLEMSANAAGIGVWSVDGDGKNTEWNEQMFAIFGRPPQAGAPSICEWLGEHVHPQDRQRVQAVIESWAGLDDAAGEFEYRVLRPDGEVRWLAARFGTTLQPGSKRLVGIMMDRTDQKRAESALHGANERAALATRSAGIGTWEVDFEAGTEHWDEQMFVLRGLSPGPRAPTRSERLAMLHPDDLDVTVDAAGPLAGVGTGTTSYEFRVVRPDGEVCWLASRSIAVTDAAGRLLRRIGVNWDITQARHAEAGRREREVAQRENRAKSQFMARMSHELRTPLNAVLGFAQLLQADPETRAAQRDKLDLIASAGQHLLSLIDDVLDLSNLQTGDLKLGCEPVALLALVAETLPLLEPLAARHGVSLRVGALPGVALADRVRLRQVLINLVSNAIKYNRPHGHVTLDAATAAGRVVLCVADSGRGLSEPQCEQLFEPFNRLGAERDGIEGTGIGLVIVKALVERMGGTVTVQSRAGQGSAFSVDLPAAAAPAGEGKTPMPTGSREDDQRGRDHGAAGNVEIRAGSATVADRCNPTAHTPGAAAGRLLYIEDNAVNRLLVEGLVAHRPGLELHSAENGAEGVARALALLPGLTLIDMQLPDFDGFEVLRRLRADPRTAGLRCIALSANALPEDIALALAAGFDGYWTKPIRFERFLAGLDSVFGVAPPAAQGVRSAG